MLEMSNREKPLLKPLLCKSTYRTWKMLPNFLRALISNKSTYGNNKFLALRIPTSITRYTHLQKLTTKSNQRTICRLIAQISSHNVPISHLSTPNLPSLPISKQAYPSTPPPTSHSQAHSSPYDYHTFAPHKAHYSCIPNYNNHWYTFDEYYVCLGGIGVGFRRGDQILRARRGR